jgi:hypothetical protein
MSTWPRLFTYGYMIQNPLLDIQGAFDPISDST